MKVDFKVLLAGSLLAVCSSPALANDLEGQVESVNQNERSFVVQGIRFFVTEATDYDDGLREFADLKDGQTVEVDFEYRDGRHVATEIELEE